MPNVRRDGCRFEALFVSGVWKEVTFEAGVERHLTLLGVESGGRTARLPLPYPSTGGPRACLPLLLFGGRQGGGSARRKSSTSIRRWQPGLLASRPKEHPASCTTCWTCPGGTVR